MYHNVKNNKFICMIFDADSEFSTEITNFQIKQKILNCWILLLVAKSKTLRIVVGVLILKH